MVSGSRLDERVRTATVVELVQTMIRNRCVNERRPDSGHEARNADALAAVLAGPGVEIERYESLPGRANLVARIEGRRVDAPTLCLLAHTDVVPVPDPSRWERDPFGGELVDGVVWGRGAVDMLSHAASMAVAMRTLADGGFRPDGTLVFAAVADHEDQGEWGTRWLLEHHPDAVACDWVVTETGGAPVPGPDHVTLPILVAEKGSSSYRVAVHGEPGRSAATPYGTQSGPVRAAEVIRRIAAYDHEPVVTPLFREMVAGFGFGAVGQGLLDDPATLAATLSSLPHDVARFFHALTHNTLSVVGIEGAGAASTMAETVTLEVNVRSLPGADPAAGADALRSAVGDLWPHVDIEETHVQPATESPTDTPLWDSLARLSHRWYERATLLPTLSAARTDGRFFREMGAVVYGYGMCSTNIAAPLLADMYHDDNERLDVETMAMMTELWEALALDVLVS